MRRWRMAAGGLAAAAAALVLCAPAAAQIYWANEGGTTIDRATLAGVITDPPFITGAVNPSGVAINGTHIYWSHDAAPTGAIGRADIDGSNPSQTLLTTSSFPEGVAVDA